MFGSDGTFRIEGAGWDALVGSWQIDGQELILRMPDAPPECTGPGRYQVRRAANRLSLTLADDECVVRRMILDGSAWRPVGEAEPIPERRINANCGRRADPIA